MSNYQELVARFKKAGFELKLVHASGKHGYYTIGVGEIKYKFNNLVEAAVWVAQNEIDYTAPRSQILLALLKRGATLAQISKLLNRKITDEELGKLLIPLGCGFFGHQTSNNYFLLKK